MIPPETVIRVLAVFGVAALASVFWWVLARWSPGDRDLDEREARR